MNKTTKIVDDIFGNIRRELDKLKDVELELREALNHSDETTKEANREVVTAIKSVKEANKDA